MRKIEEEEEGKKRTRHTILLPEPPQHVILSLSLSTVYRLSSTRRPVGRTDGYGTIGSRKRKDTGNKNKGMDGRTDGRTVGYERVVRESLS